MLSSAERPGRRGAHLQSGSPAESTDESRPPVPHGPSLPEAVTGAARLRREGRVGDALAMVESALGEARARPSDTPFRDRVLLGLTLADLLLLAGDHERARNLLEIEAAFAERVLQLIREGGSPEQVLAASTGYGQLRDRAIQIGLLGTEAPEIDVDHWVPNGPTTLADQRGDVVLLEFWAPWCKPCLAMLPALQDLFQRHGRGGLQILALTHFRRQDSDGRKQELEVVRQFVIDHDLKFPVGICADAQTRQHYGANGIPTYALVDRAGIVRLASSKPDKAALEQTITDLLNTPVGN
ncbi:TlpA family protein disulfide reductase [Mycobacterium sp. pV006]|uniref:TlpA family protein disulfide reductase n=1 Tax=Mycobacterium sp. pV006 TaxID=3238983 RepID=UPI00351BA72A